MVERIEITNEPTPAEKPAEVVETPVAPVVEGVAPATPETPAAPVEETPAETPKEGEEEQVKEQIEAAGIDFSSLETEASETGTLSDENFEKLEKIGFPKDVVNEFIEFRKAQAEGVRTEVLAVVGGEEKFAEKAAWARENMSEADIKEFNAAMESRDKARMKNAMSSLEAAYVKVNGKTPKLVTATSSAPATGTVYRSMSEFLRDQANPLYKTDPAFRADVTQKLSRSNI